MSEPLVMPRSLAIRILHEAQIAQPKAIHGVIGARDGEPVSCHIACGEPPPGVALWAMLWSNPLAAAVPEAQQLRDDALSVVVSLNTKGVLEMRAWRLRDGMPDEQVLRIRD